MTLLDVHPEHLIDGFLESRLSDSEQAQLEEHLLQCDACRLELSLSNDLAFEGAAGAGSTQRADELAVDRALSSMVANQVLRVPALKTLPGQRVPGQRVSGRKKLATRAMAGTLLFALGAAAAVIVMQQNLSDGGESTSDQDTIQTMSSSLAPSPVPPAVLQELEQEIEKEIEEFEAPATENEKKSAPEPTGNSEELETAATGKEAASSKGAVEKSPIQSAADLFRLATMKRREGKQAEAVATYQKLQARFPNSPEALISRLALGRLLASSSPSLAYAQYDTYLRQGGPLRPEALVGRAKALSAMGQTARAKAAWQEVLEAAPNSIYAEQARRHLSPSQP